MREIAGDSAPLSSLPSPDQLARLVEAEKEALAHTEAFKPLVGSPAFGVLLQMSGASRDAIRQGLVYFLTKRQELSRRPEPWLAQGLQDVLGGRDGGWRNRLETTSRELADLSVAARSSDAVRVEHPPDVGPSQVLADAQLLLEHLSRGGRWSFLGFPLGPARGRTYLRESVRVDGQLASSVGVLQKLVKTLQAHRRLDSLWRVWEPHAPRSTGRLVAQLAEIEEHCRCLSLLLGLLEHTRQLGGLLAEEPALLALAAWTTDEPSKLLGILDAVDATLAAEEAHRLTSGVGDALRALAGRRDSHPVNRRLLEALAERDVPRWSENYVELEGIERDRKRQERRADLEGRLRAACPSLATSLAASPLDEAWPSRLGRFEEAWDSAFARNWLVRRERPDYGEQLARDVDRLSQAIQETLAKLAATKAWESFLSKLEPKQVESLIAWKKAVKEVGKGTGKTAEKFRSAARQYLADCVSALPAWIMPRYRVAETLEPRPELFDVVIVDEASQTGVDGLFLAYLGKKLVVVGDDQQISPAGVGIPDADVTALQGKHLKGIPFGQLMGPTNSLYDHAAIKFQGRIVLREHFRCVPEIIEFSNELCYAPNGSPLIPLRQYPPQRLEPVVTRFIADGYRVGKAHAQNPREAEALVAQLASCLQDPRYQGKTFGVISLLGNAQAELIERRLVDVVGPEEMERRRLVCGDAYAFQGDERDVMFLSLVSAPNSAIGSLTKQSDIQRFNVAASRAKDQLWLFHSASLDDLGSSCVRRKLLEYCLNPRRADVDTSTDEFDSEFEQEVCERIRARGYLVRTQVRAGDQIGRAFRIDLVVEGARGRLAIECDGDSSHGVEHFEADMARQRALERCGWIFFRVRASSFYLDRDRALGPLWDTLERLGIRPGGRDDTAPHAPPPPLEIRPSADSERATDTGANDVVEHRPVAVPPRQEQKSPEPSPRGSRPEAVTPSAPPTTRAAEPVRPFRSTTATSPAPRQAALPFPAASPAVRLSRQLVCRELQRQEETLRDPRCAACCAHARLDARSEGILIVCMDAKCGQKTRVDLSLLQQLARTLRVTCYSCHGESLESREAKWTKGWGSFLSCTSCGSKNYWDNVNDRLEAQRPG